MKFSTCLFLVGTGLVGCGDNTEGKCDPEVPGTICTIAGGTLDQGYKGDGGQATDATMYIPIDSVIAPDGNVWFLDFNNYVIRSIDADGIIETVVGNGEVGDSPVSDHQTEVPALNQFANHTPSMLFSGEYLYLASWHQSRLTRVRLADMMVERFAGAGVRTKYTGDGGSALDAALDLPSGIAAAPDGGIVFTDQANLAIRRVDPGGIISTIAGSCIIEERTCTNTGTTPAACPGSMKSTCGDPSTSCGGSAPCSAGFAGDGGPASAARFNMPGGQAADPTGKLAYDHAGNLWFADTANHRIRKIDTAGTITTVAGNGMSGFSGDGPGTSIKLNWPVDIAVGDDDSIYFTDVKNNCVRRIDGAGLVATVAGQCNEDPAAREFGGDGGDPLEAKLNRPYGVHVAGNKLYVADSYNNRLRVVNME